MKLEEKKPTNSDMVDLFKFIASVLIFAMHCSSLRDYGGANFTLELISRWGVPFFFTCSSYFLFSKCSNEIDDKKNIIKYICRILRLYFVWLLFNIPSFIYTKVYDQDMKSIQFWFGLLKNSLLSSTYIGSWYLTSSIFSAFLIYFLSKKFNNAIILFLSGILYLFSIFSSVYYGALPPYLSTILLGLCFPLNIFNGCIYFALGKTIYENNEKIFHFFSKKKLLFCIILFYFSFVLEIYISKRFMLYKTSDVAFSTIFIGLFCFLFCINSKIKVKNSKLLRKLSTIIYCCQGNVLLINSYLRKNMSSLLAFLISFGLILFIGAVIIFLQKKTRWKWLEYIT